MSKATKPIPEGLRTVTPQIVATDAKKLVAFMEAAFSAKPMHMMPGPDGKGVMHGFVGAR